ncbi:MAG TPA: methyltransferase [Longimicrobiaceae bacterium]
MTRGEGVATGSPLWRAIRWIHRRRPLLTAFFVIAVIGMALFDPSPPADLIRPRPTFLFVVPWLLMIIGVAVRIWGAGNLRKNREITRTGVYRMVRHPLYVGSLAMFLAMFLTVGDPVTGAALFATMVVLVYYPTMMDEEAYLQEHFPEQTADYVHLPRLLPNVFRIGDAMRSDRFTVSAARANLGLRSLGFLIALPALLELLRWIEGRI